jgi:hypothetical protein
MPAENNTVTKYDFIDSLRFISMIAIVMEHSSLLLGKNFPTFSGQLIQVTTIQFFKYGTIIFFLVSGFLIGDKFSTYSPAEYFKRRWDNTFKPWVFWFVVAIALNYLNLWVVYLKFGMQDLVTSPWSTLYHQIYDTLFATSLWFIVNFLICIAILLSFQRYMDSLIFGAILCAFSLFYSVNLYYVWVPAGHTTAIFGFVFYLWLGYKINKNFAAFTNWVNKTSTWYFAFAFLVTYVASCYESMNMMQHHNPAALNTLRFTNIWYSLVCFVLLFKYYRIFHAELFKPRMLTFGIYFIHHLLINHVIPEIFRPMGYHNEDYRPMWQMLSMSLVQFVLAYGLSMGLAYFIAKGPKKISWIIGQ